LIIGFGPSLKEVREQLSFFRFRVKDEVVNESPGFGIEDGGAVLLVVIRRVVVDLKEGFEGNDFVSAEDFEIAAGNLADLDFLFADVGVAQEDGIALVEPERKVAEIEAEESMGILVVDNFVGILPREVGANGDKVAFFARDVKPGGMEVAFGLPIGWKEGFEGVFVLDGEDENGLTQVGAQAGKNGMEDFANLFELGGDAAGFAFTGVADDDEVGGADFEPVVKMVGRGEGGGEE